jgi:hypothetical protein
MDSDTISKMLGLFMLFGIPFLYVWKAKHPELNIWEASARFFIILYGTPTLVVLLGLYLPYFLFEGSGEIHMALPKGILAVLGTSAVFPAIYVARKRVKIAPFSKV